MNFRKVVFALATAGLGLTGIILFFYGDSYDARRLEALFVAIVLVEFIARPSPSIHDGLLFKALEQRRSRALHHPVVPARGPRDGLAVAGHYITAPLPNPAKEEREPAAGVSGGNAFLHGKLR